MVGVCWDDWVWVLRLRVEWLVLMSRSGVVVQGGFSDFFGLAVWEALMPRGDWFVLILSNGVMVWGGGMVWAVRPGVGWTVLFVVVGGVFLGFLNLGVWRSVSLADFWMEFWVGGYLGHCCDLGAGL